MWNFIYQNAGIILFILVMVFMHRRGGAGGGCCGGGHQHGPSEPRYERGPQEGTFTGNEGGSLHRH